MVNLTIEYVVKFFKDNNPAYFEIVYLLLYDYFKEIGYMYLWAANWHGLYINVHCPQTWTSNGQTCIFYYEYSDFKKIQCSTF